MGLAVLERGDVRKDALWPRGQRKWERLRKGLNHTFQLSLQCLSNLVCAKIQRDQKGRGSGTLERASLGPSCSRHCRRRNARTESAAKRWACTRRPAGLPNFHENSGVIFTHQHGNLPGLSKVAHKSTSIERMYSIRLLLVLCEFNVQQRPCVLFSRAT